MQFLATYDGPNGVIGVWLTERWAAVATLGPDGLPLDGITAYRFDRFGRRRAEQLAIARAEAMS